MDCGVKVLAAATYFWHCSNNRRSPIDALRGFEDEEERATFWLISMYRSRRVGLSEVMGFLNE
jgi:hypothetical protein